MSVWLLKATPDGGMDFGSDLNRARLKEHLKEHAGKTYRLEYVQPKRSLSQNNYYWLYLGIIARETGDHEKALHEFFKQEFLPKKAVSIMGKARTITKSTTSLSKVEMGEYLDKICAMTNVPLPDPEEAGYITN